MSRTEIDREKVNKGLKCHQIDKDHRINCSDCPYHCDEFMNGLNELHNDALALLKEQEAKEGHWIVLEYCANEGIYCSECHMKIFDRTTKPKKKLSQYCPHCGSRNEQFFRDGEVVFR